MHEREGGHGILLQVSRAGQMVCKDLCVAASCVLACCCKPNKALPTAIFNMPDCRVSQLSARWQLQP